MQPRILTNKLKYCQRVLSFSGVPCPSFWKDPTMNSALPYLPTRRSRFWIAFVCAAAIHIGAIVLANKSEKTAIQDFGPRETDIEVIETGPEPTPPEESVSPPLPQASPDEETFLEENRTPRRVRPSNKTRVAHFTRGTLIPFGSVKALVLYAPRPPYPYEARRQRMTGSGIALLTVDAEVGNVTSVRMMQSCGNPILDNATLEALRKWRFKPGSTVNVQVPITYTLTGVSY
jgi:TonB family protein